MSDKTYYQLLQVDSAASIEVIEAAYRRLAKVYHPDLNSSPNAAKTMQELNQAYAVLRDAIKRRDYDEKLRHNHAKATSYNSQTSSSQHSDYTTPPDFPVTCMGCGMSDATLRLAAFPYVISIVFLTFRRYISGLYCTKCRQKQMLKCKILTLCLGWWGFPFGIFYTLAVLFKPAQGEILTDVNGDYLKGLGLYFLTQRNLVDAESAWTASLCYKYDSEVSKVYADVFGKRPNLSARNSHGEGTGVLWGLGLILFVLFGLPGMLTAIGGSSSAALSSPTLAVALPKPTASATHILKTDPLSTKISVVKPTGTLPPTIKKGTRVYTPITVDGAEMRTGPSTVYDIAGTWARGARVAIAAYTTCSNKTWYLIGQNRWIDSIFVDLPQLEVPYIDAGCTASSTMYIPVTPFVTGAKTTTSAEGNNPIELIATLTSLASDVSAKTPMP